MSLYEYSDVNLAYSKPSTAVLATPFCIRVSCHRSAAKALASSYWPCSLLTSDIYASDYVRTLLTFYTLKATMLSTTRTAVSGRLSVQQICACESRHVFRVYLDGNSVAVVKWWTNKRLRDQPQQVSIAQ